MATFKDQLEIDIAHLLNTDEFAISVQHINGAINEQLKVIFNGPQENMIVDTFELVTSGPLILLRTQAAGNIDKDSRFVIDAKTYYLLERSPDHEGLTIITLTEHQDG